MSHLSSFGANRELLEKYGEDRLPAHEPARTTDVA